jgi:hypothetical protein
MQITVPYLTEVFDLLLKTKLADMQDPLYLCLFIYLAGCTMFPYLPAPI